jgi:two-component system response regulator AtoC
MRVTLGVRATTAQVPALVAPIAAPPAEPSDELVDQTMRTEPASQRDREKSRILQALAECAGNQTAAARLLGVSRRTLINKLELHGITRPRKGR